MIMMHDLEKGSLLNLFKKHKDFIYSLKFDEYTSTIVSGSADKTALLWDIRSGKAVRTIEDHSAIITGVDVNLARGVICTAGVDGFL